MYFESWFKRFDRLLEQTTRPVSCSNLEMPAFTDLNVQNYHTVTQLDVMADQINDGFTDIQDRVGDDIDNKFDSVESMIGDVDGKIEDLENKIGEVVDKLVDVDGKIEDLEGRIGEVVDKLVDVENTFNDMDGKFDGVETFVDNRLEATEEILDRSVHEIKRDMEYHFPELAKTMDYRLKDLEKKMDFQFQDIRTLSHNGLCRQGWQQVKPVWRTNAQGNRALPLHFPHTVIGFWKLKEAPKSECGNDLLVDDLADMIGNVLRDLLRFYKVQGFEEWPMDHEDQDRAEAYQGLAHQALAIELGLSYDAIQANMERKTTPEHVDTAPPAGPGRGQKRRRVTSLDSTDPPRTPSAALPAQPVARRTRAKRVK